MHLLAVANRRNVDLFFLHTIKERLKRSEVQYAQLLQSSNGDDDNDDNEERQQEAAAVAAEKNVGIGLLRVQMDSVRIDKRN